MITSHVFGVTFSQVSDKRFHLLANFGNILLRYSAAAALCLPLADRCHSLLLACSATGSARKRPLRRVGSFAAPSPQLLSFFVSGRFEPPDVRPAGQHPLRIESPPAGRQLRRPLAAASLIFCVRQI